MCYEDFSLSIIPGESEVRLFSSSSLKLLELGENFRLSIAICAGQVIPGSLAVGFT